MDHSPECLDALEQQVQTLTQHTHTVQRRLRWWRGLAGGLAVVGLLGWGLPLGLAREDAPDKDQGEKGLAQRVAALEDLLKHFSREDNEVFLTGANLHIVNGLGQTGCGTEEEPIPDCPNGLGNLIVGYNELRDLSGCDPEDPLCKNTRTGSHNVVVGRQHNFSRVGGLVVGDFNTISGDFAVVSGGESNIASGFNAAVSGGRNNTASGEFGSSVSGGVFNTASGIDTSVSGGSENTASGFNAAVSGGVTNTASDAFAAVSGGNGNTASGAQSTVSGGVFNTASGVNAVVSGGFGNTASGEFSSVSGGDGNTASGAGSSVSGGLNITQGTDFSWAAGSEGEEVFVGNFRSP
jgi:hypothetical protein